MKRSKENAAHSKWEICAPEGRGRCASVCVANAECERMKKGVKSKRCDVHNFSFPLFSLIISCPHRCIVFLATHTHTHPAWLTDFIIFFLLSSLTGEKSTSYVHRCIVACIADDVRHHSSQCVDGRWFHKHFSVQKWRSVWCSWLVHEHWAAWERGKQWKG